MWRLPRRIYLGGGRWEVTADEAEFCVERGYVTVDGSREPVRLLASVNGRAVLGVGTDDSEYRRRLDRALEEGKRGSA